MMTELAKPFEQDQVARINRWLHTDKQFECQFQNDGVVVDLWPQDQPCDIKNAFTLSAAHGNQEIALWVQLDVQNTPLTLAMNHHALSLAGLQADFISQLPDSLTQAIVFKAISPMLKCLVGDQASMACLSVTAQSNTAFNSEDFYLGLNLASQAHTELTPQCMLIMPNEFERQLHWAQAYSSPKATPTDVPLAARLLVGETSLSPRLLNEVSVGDIVLLKTHCEPMQVVIELTSQLRFQAHIDNASLVIDKPLKNRSENNMEPATAEESTTPELEAVQEPSVDVNELPVNMTFELAEQEMTLGAISELVPGYCLDLDIDLDTPLAIKANGKIIGRGELIKVANKMGVRVTSLGA